MIRRRPRTSILTHVFGEAIAALGKLTESTIDAPIAPDFCRHGDLANLPNATKEKLFDLNLLGKMSLDGNVVLRRAERILEFPTDNNENVQVKMGRAFEKVIRFLEEFQLRVRGV